MNANHLIAHRGWQQRFPENTMLALAGAIATGALHVETDIQVCADRVAVLCHDATLQRLCGSPLDITQAHEYELAVLSAHEPERFGERFVGTPLARLSECVALIAAHPEVTLYAELKRHSLRRFGVDAVLDVVLPELQAIAGQCVLISFDLAVLQRARERGWARLAPVLSSWSQVHAPAIAALRPELFFCDKDLLLPPAEPGDAGWPLALFEIADHDEALDWRRRGAALIETFAIGEMLAAGDDR